LRIHYNIRLPYPHNTRKDVYLINKYSYSVKIKACDKPTESIMGLKLVLIDLYFTNVSCFYFRTLSMNKTITSRLKQLNIKITTTDDVGNPGPRFGQEQKCGEVKPINGMPCSW
jgi:hypothetical protein